MALLDTSHQRAALLVILLGLGLGVALAPYATGLIGAIVLYVIFAPVNDWLKARVSPAWAAAIIVIVALLVIVLPSIPLAGAIIGQANDMAHGMMRSPILDKVATLRIGTFDVGAQLAALGETLIAWLGTSAFNLVGTATRLVLNMS